MLCLEKSFFLETAPFIFIKHFLIVEFVAFLASPRAGVQLRGIEGVE